MSATRFDWSEYDVEGNSVSICTYKDQDVWVYARVEGNERHEGMEARQFHAFIENVVIEDICFNGVLEATNLEQAKKEVEEEIRGYYGIEG